jgi:DNA adenine methylase
MGFGSDSISRMKASRVGFNTRLSSTMSTGFRWNSNRSGTTPASDWRNYPQNLAAFIERLQGVVLEQRDAQNILEKMDGPECLHYVDPPYPFSVRKIGNGTTPEHRYRHEMVDADHEALAGLLHGLRGMVVISSYPGPLYSKLYADWETISWTGAQFCGDNRGARERTEQIWLNPEAVRASKRSLFD